MASRQGLQSEQTALNRPTIFRRTAKRFEWDKSGMFLAVLLFLGECIAVALAAISGQWAALISALVLALYVPLAIWMGKMPFASPTEYEKRRIRAEKILAIRIPRSTDTMQTNLMDCSDESIKVAVGQAYCLGAQDLQVLCKQPWRQDVKQKILEAQFRLIPPKITAAGILFKPELMENHAVSTRGQE